MIENILLHFKTKTAFNTELEAGNVQQTSIAFIDDSKEIWTHGEFYDSSKIDLSSFVTKDELTEALSTKQDTISDIETIRSGASKGSTALQSYTETDPVFSTSVAANIKSTDITNWNSKTSNAGTITGITMNGSSKGTSGVVDLGTVITEHQDISGKLDTTVASNTYATKSEVTTGLNGKIAQNGTVTSIVAMTQAEYDALETKDATTLYIITD